MLAVTQCPGDESANELSDVRPHSTSEIHPFLDTQSLEFSSEDNAFKPQAPRIESMDVALTESELRHGGSVELHSRQTIGTSESFDSTAALTASPNPRPISPFAAVQEEFNKQTRASPLDHTVPKTIGEIEGASDPVIR